jgi:hypothetical protein
LIPTACHLPPHASGDSAFWASSREVVKMRAVVLKSLIEIFMVSPAGDRSAAVLREYTLLV